MNRINHHLSGYKLSAITLLLTSMTINVHAAPIAGGSLSPEQVPKYVTPLVIPPAMPRAGTIVRKGQKNIDYYEIAVRQFQQQLLPPGFPLTTVWSYGAINTPSSFNYPAFTIEAKYNAPVRVKWINGLVDNNGGYLPHLLAVDQTLHWANPAGPRDSHGMDPTPYTGPVPIVTHVHGAHVGPASDGYPEAWFLPNANNIPAGYFTQGSHYRSLFGSEPGAAVFEYPNQQRASTLWYHDHTLGMTRLNVYAGPAGFYLLRGGKSDLPAGVLPAPAPALGDPAGTKYFEIPLAIQDRSFNADGSLFYPNNRAFFEGLDVADLQIPFIPEPAKDGASDVSPIWNPEFFGNMMLVNGKTWPYLNVENKRYRFRILNGSNARYLILKMDNNQTFYQIGNEGGFLTAPVPLTSLLISPAERADVIIDFSNLRPGTTLTLLNIGPDEPFGGGVPGVDFMPSDPNSTGQIMQFRVVKGTGADKSTPPMQLALPAITPLPAVDNVRQVSLNEKDSQTVFVVEEGGKLVFDPNSPFPFGPIGAFLGTLNNGEPTPLGWMDAITENPGLNSTEIWEIYNFTADAHPIHLHQVSFEVVNRQVMGQTQTYAPAPWETGTKDTVTAYPGEITRLKATFDIEGLYVWHCHIVEHEDNEMMRPYCVGNCNSP
jgi:spore coat protein A